MKTLVRILVAWLPLAVAITGICLLVYGTVQQNYRQSLNDPQIQMAENGAAALAAGDVPASVVPRGTMVDISKSLTPWIAVYDDKETPLESSGVLDGKPPLPPQGVFDAATGSAGKDTQQPNEDRVTWQADDGTRSAVVVVYVPETKQFVVAGRNMREVENREGQLSIFVGLAWITLLIATFVATLFADYFLKIV